MVYNRAYGVLACVAGRFPLKGNYTTKVSNASAPGFGAGAFFIGLGLCVLQA